MCAGVFRAQRPCELRRIYPRRQAGADGWGGERCVTEVYGGSACRNVCSTASRPTSARHSLWNLSLISPPTPIPSLTLLRVWDPKTGECKVTVQGHPFHEGGLTSLDIHPDSTVVLTGSEDGTAKVVNIHTGREAVHAAVQCPVQGRACSTDMRNLDAEPRSQTEIAACMFHGPFLLLFFYYYAWCLPGVCLPPDACAGRVLSSLTAGIARGENNDIFGIETVAFSRLLPLALTGGLDGRLVMWDVATASTRAVCQHPEVRKQIWSVFSSNQCM